MTNEPVITEAVTLSFEEAFAQVRILVVDKLSSAPGIVRNYTRHLVAAQGKYIRTSALLTCAMDSGDRIHPDAVNFAAAIELLHLATLVHDDVMDNAEIRRGVPALHKKYGTRTAVICGDYLFCIALQTASGCRRPKDRLEFDMPDYMGRICLGELSQHINNGNMRLSVYQYLKIISGKTAALFEASFFAGAMISETDEAVIRRYRRLGHCLGMMFQLTDDCNDFEVNKAAAKKPVQSDYEQGVFTLPLIYTLKTRSGFMQELEAGLVTRSEMNEAVFTAGGLDYAHKVAKKYHQKSMKIVDLLPLSEEKRKRLVAILGEACNWK